MVKLNTIEESVKSAIPCLLAAEHLRYRATSGANAAAIKATAEAWRSLSDVPSWFGDLRHIYATMEKTNQSPKNSPMVCKIH